MRRANGRREKRLDLIWQKFTDWLKEILIGGITDALSGLFDTVNTRVGEIAGQVGATPQGWNGGIYNMIRSLSDNVILPIAGVILAIVMTMPAMPGARANPSSARSICSTNATSP